LLRSPHPRKGETIYLILDDSKKAKRGRTMDAVAKMQDPTTATAQDQLRSLLWRDLLVYLKEKRHDQPVIEALERLRVA
jgi:hypothetical protein